VNGCRACFRDGGPVELTDERPSLGDCAFCGSKATDTWPVAVWRDHFMRVIEMYEPSDAPDARVIHVRLQGDWQIFAFDDADIAERFLTAMFEDGQASINLAIPVRPRFDTQGAGADHTSRWEQFRHELMTVNRFFPAVSVEREYLEGLVRDHLSLLAEGLALFRGRTRRTGDAFTPSEMGVPPAELVVGGRGNPVGIPHLYLADSVETCLKESRASLNGFVSVAQYEIARPVHVLDLRKPKPENPFLVDEDDVGGALLRTLVASQFLRKLGRELSTPTRPGENQIEYVPTQYLCEFVKSIGKVGGICYASSLHNPGWNLVLFQLTDAVLVEPVQSYEVTGMDFAFRPVPVPIVAPD